MKRIIVDFIIETAAAYYGITVAELTSRQRNEEYMIPRQMVMFFIYDEKLASYAEIGEMFGDRTHATILSNCGVIRSELKHNVIRKRDYKTLKNHILNKAEVDFVITKLLANPKDVLTTIRQKLEAA